ncbi:pseudouridine synthase [Nocardia fluminea]|uniref:Pseudouridine synthase n=1 Tax=Nocardia fluminea TaxID=134984 RepID=A0A2N3WYE5_9NOCA|nr:pseudouridine synthase [Nocardia fluminea]PKV98875.1 23S rRNA pseudouridine2605 synthase [Nocardia fluminea]
MNNSARRDGTPDRRNRSDQPRSGANRTSGNRGEGARTGQGGSRGAAPSRRGTGAGGFQRGNQTAARSAGSYQRDAESGGGGYQRDDRRGASTGGDRRGSSPGGYQRDDRRSAPAGRGASAGGYQRDDRRGASAGGDRRGPSAGGYQRGGSAGAGQRDDRRGTGAASGGGYPRGDVQRGGTAGQRSGASAGTQAFAARKKSTKPQKKVVAPTILNNAKPARHQYADVTEGPKKLPWGEGERLQKVLAKAGVASRRAAEEMIAAGRVEVDGKIVREQGLRIDAENAVVRVDGTRVVVRDELVHLVLNKPRGWQSTMSDDLGRPCVGDIIAERIAAGQRLFHVGRLDADTEGLLLVTNDGEMAHRLMHPSYEVPKTYLATVDGEVNYRLVGKRLREGVELEDGPAKVDKFMMLEANHGRSLVKLVLHEGRKHIVRRLLDEVGHPVIRLVRTHLGPVALGDQRPGTLRVLGRDEIGKLYEAVQL